MEADYPAAHSMDTCWFAVDAIGQIAMFATGENGHAPDTLEANDIRGELWDLYKPADADEDDYWDVEDLCRFGIYYFGYNDDFDPIGPYGREGEVQTPLHIDQLPFSMRDRCREVSFDLRFDQVEQIQPLEFVPCVYWYEDDRVAYLCGDGKTVKPIPGKEEEFAAFVREMRQNQPEEARKLIFDGPTE